MVSSKALGRGRRVEYLLMPKSVPMVNCKTGEVGSVDHPDRPYFDDSTITSLAIREMQ